VLDRGLTRDVGARSVRPSHCTDELRRVSLRLCKAESRDDGAVDDVSARGVERAGTGGRHRGDGLVDSGLQSRQKWAVHRSCDL